MRSTCRSRAASITTPASSTRPCSTRIRRSVRSAPAAATTTSPALHQVEAAGVGISIGLTRLFYQLREAGLVASAGSSVDVLVALLDDDGSNRAGAVAAPARGRFERRNAAGAAKLAKQLQYADAEGRDPLRRHARRRRDRARRGRGEGPAQRRTVRGGRRAGMDSLAELCGSEREHDA